MSASRRFASERFGDRGYAIAMTALMLVPIMIGAALAVDVGGWYAQASKMQRAADAASLAGVVFLPDQSKSIQAARDVAASHGFPSSVNCSTTDAVKVCVTPRPLEQRLDVKIDAQGRIFFAKVAGVSKEPLSRDATAEYVPALPMGSPLSQMGNDPTVTGYEPDFWLGQSGVANAKGTGDRYTAASCNTPLGSGTTTMWGCTGTTNNEQRPEGYVYILRVPASAAGQTIVVEAFDPAFVNSKNDCSLNGTGGAGPYCTGDNESLLGPSAASADCLQAATYASPDTTANVVCTPTTYIVRTPDLTPSNNTDNPAVCGVTFRGWDVNNPASATTAEPWAAPLRLQDVFHKWVPVCTIANAVAGDYVLQVKTNANLTNMGGTPARTATASLNLGTTGQAATRTNVAGQNNFSFRAGVSGQTVGSANWSRGISLFADGRLPIYVNSDKAEPEFYLAKVTTTYAGTSLIFDLFDIADAPADEPEAVTLTAPPEATNPPTTCTWTRDGGSMVNGTAGGCTYSNLKRADYNGRLTSVHVNLPAGYKCNPTTTLQCWFRIKIKTDEPNDFTTWSARVTGDPVHLVE